jgi:hypothetical protein
MSEIDSILEGMSRKIWQIPTNFSTSGLHAPADELGLNIPTVWEDYCGSTIRSWTQILNGEGALGATARASYRQAAEKIKSLPIELAFHTRNDQATCPSVIGRNVATLPNADLHPMGATEIWSGNQISAPITARIPNIMDKDGCPVEEQPFPQPTKILHRLVPLWEFSIHDWAQILGRGPDGGPYFLDERELKWANPTMRTPLPQPLLAALTYLRALLASANPDNWAKLKKGMRSSPLWDLPIAPRWRRIFEEDWSAFPNTPSSLALDMATL